MGLSVSKASSEQKGRVYIAQQFAGTCNVSCQDSMKNVTVDIINSDIGGGISLSQTCSTDASCIIGSSTDAVADISFKAKNSSNARNAWSVMGLDPFNVDTSDSSSRQNIKESINQNTNEKCNISSYDQMDNITIFAANSTIGGDISISQNSSTEGQCRLKNQMTAAAYATGTAQNVSKSGKDKKGEKLGEKAEKLKVITYVVIAIVVIVLVIIVSKLISKHSKTGKIKGASPIPKLSKNLIKK